MYRRQIPLDQFKAALTYDPETGIFTSKRTGKPVGFAWGTGGAYIGIAISRENGIFFAHRVAWAFVHGDCPTHLDHINGDGKDNRIANLRPCTQSENNRNQRTRKNKAVASKGVTRFYGGLYRARIIVHGKEISLGYFKSEQEAADAYKRAAEHHFGSFARTP